MDRVDIAGMRVLALADRPFHADVAKLASQCDVEAIVSLGDLQPSWLETLDKVALPKLGVYGNHDDEPYMTWFGIDNVHVNRIDLDNGAVVQRLRGLRVLPALGHAQGRPVLHAARGQEADQEAARRRRPALPLPAAGVNDDPDDPAHIGFEALPPWVLDTSRAGCCTATSTPRPAASCTASATRGSSTSTAPASSNSPEGLGPMGGQPYLLPDWLPPYSPARCDATLEGG